MRTILTIVLAVCMSHMLRADAIHEAAYHGLLDEVKLLVNSGANVNARDQLSHDTPLVISIERGYPEIALVLLQRGAKTYLGSWEPKSQEYTLPMDIALYHLSWASQYHPELVVRYSNIVRILKQYRAISSKGSGISTGNEKR